MSKVLIIACVFLVLSFIGVCKATIDGQERQLGTLYRQGAFLREDVGRLKDRVSRLEAELASVRQRVK